MNASSKLYEPAVVMVIAAATDVTVVIHLCSVVLKLNLIITFRSRQDTR